MLWFNKPYDSSLLGVLLGLFQSNVPNALWKLGKLNHVAIAVPNLEKASALYRDVLKANVGPALVRFHCDMEPAN